MFSIASCGALENIVDYQNKYLYLCRSYAKKYLDEAKFQKFTNSYCLAPSQMIGFGGLGNDSFITYAQNKIKIIENN